MMVTVGISVVSAARADEGPSVDMHLVPANAVRDLMHMYIPRPVKLSSDAPAELKKKPEMLSPLYGTIQFGGKAHILALDEPDGKDARLYVDAKGDGDLTDSPPVEWKKQASNGHTMYNGSFKLSLAGNVKKPVLVNLVAYRFDPKDPQRAGLSHTLLYYADYAREGHIKIGNEIYHAVLTNEMGTGDFRGKDDHSAGRLLIDLNQDGKFSGASETFDPNKPFNVKGSTWRVADMTGAGEFRLEQSDQKVAEVPLPANLSKGHNAIAFTATTTNGKQVKFPRDYQGKLVMLDFWATWCGPCMGEVPGLVKTYNEYHSKGFDILGISLDQPNQAGTVTKVTGQKGMTWPQVYDGKFWQSRVGQMYFIDSIPHAFLVDGDSGKIVAEGNDLRGLNLEPTLKAALGEKQPPGATK
jgi:thiol-disulfide isomerase/thioredoxin